ncbi:hypothetical protein ABPG75_000008 [Micractinium tetrahymenae]
MAGIFNGPARGGTRGGRDQFSWDNVKTDKDREFFLGHSVKATTGRWQKGRDVFCEVDRSEADAASELAMVKQREQDLMMEACLSRTGHEAKATKQLKQAQLDKADMQKLLQGSGEQEEAGSVAAAAAAEADRILGLGFNASMTTGAIQTGRDYEKLAGVGSGAAAPPAPQTQQATAAAQPPQQPSGQGDGVPALTAEQIEELKRLRKKQEKKAAKKAHKAVKKAKKKTKKEKKKHRGGSSSGSDDDSDPPEREIHRGRSREEAAEGSGNCMLVE